MDWAKTTERRDEKLLGFDFGTDYIRCSTIVCLSTGTYIVSNEIRCIWLLYLQWPYHSWYSSRVLIMLHHAVVTGVFLRDISWYTNSCLVIALFQVSNNISYLPRTIVLQFFHRRSSIAVAIDEFHIKRNLFPFSNISSHMQYLRVMQSILWHHLWTTEPW